MGYFLAQLSQEKSVAVTHCVARAATQTTFLMQEMLGKLVSSLFFLMIFALQVFSATQRKFLMQKLQPMCNCKTFFLG